MYFLLLVSAGQSVTIASVTGPVVTGNDNVVNYTTQVRTVSDGYEQILGKLRVLVRVKLILEWIRSLNFVSQKLAESGQLWSIWLA